MLLFDCFERVAHFSRLFAKILELNQDIKILVTSRVLLGIHSEREFTLLPMSLKKRRAQMAESLTLFEEAATYSDPSFSLSRKNQKLVEALIQDLEGVPLAIVLAAGRLRHMSIQELAERVRSQRLEVLKRKPIGPDDRHADLLRVVGDSLSLLFDKDRRLVKSLSVFQGGFFQDDVVAVLGDNTEILDGISLLRDNSLLMSQVVEARMRFRLLDTIREYLDRVPDDGELTATRDRHSQHFASLAARICDLFNSGNFGAARQQLSLEIGNYRVGVLWAISTHNSELIRNYARSLARVYFETGSTFEFEMLAEAAVNVSTDEDLELLLELYGLLGEMYRRNGRIGLALEIWEKRIEICARMHDMETQVDAILDIARLALVNGMDEVTEQKLAEFSNLSDQIKHLPLRATGIVLQAQLRMKRNETVAALELCAEIEAMMKSVAVDRTALYVWLTMSQLYRQGGAVKDSFSASHRCLADSLASSHLVSVGRALIELSHNHELVGDLEGAARLIAIAWAIPASISPTHREDVLARKRQFSSGSRSQIMDAAIETMGKQDWEELAWREVPEEFRSRSS